MPHPHALTPEETAARAAAIASWTGPLRDQIARVVVGQQNLVDRLILALLCNGHVLLEGVPGLAKTLTVRTLAGAIRTGFQRLQFTPDLLPADVIGTLVYNPREMRFETKLGPIFANLILADEINRAPAKVQSALLEAMQERQVTIGGQTFALPEPFLVLATMNPLEQEGTYQLPEAQLDRFMFKVNVDYPARDEERAILDRMATSAPDLAVEPVVDPAEIVAARAAVNAIHLDPKIRDYIVDLVRATRDPAASRAGIEGLVRCGASPRAAICLALGAKARAAMRGRGYVVPQDVKDIAHDVLRHRVMVSYEAEAEGVTVEAVIDRVLSSVPVP